jgi:hypothetical protein
VPNTGTVPATSTGAGAGVQTGATATTSF